MFIHSLPSLPQAWSVAYSQPPSLSGLNYRAAPRSRTFAFQRLAMHSCMMFFRRCSFVEQCAARVA